MTHRDRGIVAALVGVLVVLAIVVAWPATGPATGTVVPGASSGDLPSAAPSRARRSSIAKATIGRPSSINPLTARTQADRDLAALIFSGLVALGPDGTYRPDLASDWTVDPKGTTWTFTIRPDATWQDGEPVTSDDVVFTVNILKSPGYTGPLAASWEGVTATAVDERTVTFELATPIGGFLQAATIGLLPSHLLSEAAVETLADDPFSVQPVGAGPFVLTSWNADSATLVPSAARPRPSPAAQPAVRDPATARSTPRRRARSTPRRPRRRRPRRPTPSAGAVDLAGCRARAPPTTAGGAGSRQRSAGLPGIRAFYPDAQACDATGGDARRTRARRPAGSSRARVLRYPRTTLTAIALNLRPGSTEFRLPALRHGLLSAIDRRG